LEGIKGGICYKKDGQWSQTQNLFKKYDLKEVRAEECIMKKGGERVSRGKEADLGR
jgi:hypothetical protein